MESNLVVRKYMNNGKIEIRYDDEGYFIRLTREVYSNKEISDVSVDFRVDSMYEIMDEELTSGMLQSAICSLIPEPKYIKLPLRFDEDGNYLRIERRLRKMTKEEIEKELGYKIDIIN